MTQQSAEETRKVRLVCLNDVYTFESGDVGHGGFAAAATAVRRVRESSAKDGYDVVVLLAGDFIGGSSLAEFSRGAAAIDVVNLVGIDAVVIGNHEFDFGWKRLEELVARSKVDVWLGGNVLRSDTGGLLNGVKAHTILETASGVRVGILGVCTQATPSLSHPGAGVEFTDVVACARESARQLRSAGVDIVVALTHLTAVQDKAVLGAVPEIDVIVGGHDHDPLAAMVHDRLLFKCGQNAYWVGTVDIDLARNSNPRGAALAPAAVSWGLQSTAGVADDEACVDIVKRYRADKDKGEREAADGDLDEVVCELQTELDTRSAVVRRRESSGGTLIADALLYFYTSRGVRADLALINGGFMRGDKLYPSGTKLTRRDVLDELPFPRVSTCIEIRGEHLVEAVEQELRFSPEPAGAFPHFSESVAIEFDVARPPLSRIVSFKVGGEPVDKDRLYRLCLTEFIAAGGDGCSSFAYGRAVGGDLAPPLRIAQVLLDYFATHRSVAPQAPGRLVQVGDAGNATDSKLD